MPFSHLILCCPLLLLPPIPLSIRVFSNESTLRMRRPKYWSFSASIGPSNEHPRLISVRIDWLDLLAVQRTLKSPIPQFRSINFSVLSFLHSPEYELLNPQHMQETRHHVTAGLGLGGRREEALKKQRKELECGEDRATCSLSRGI